MSSTPLATTGGDVCWKRLTNSAGRLGLEGEGVGQPAGHSGLIDGLPVLVGDQSGAGLDVGAVDGHGRGGAGQLIGALLLPDDPGQATALAGECALRLFELGLGGHRWRSRAGRRSTAARAR